MKKILYRSQNEQLLGVLASLNYDQTTKMKRHNAIIRIFYSVGKFYTELTQNFKKQMNKFNLKAESSYVCRIFTCVFIDLATIGI